MSLCQSVNEGGTIIAPRTCIPACIHPYWRILITNQKLYRSVWPGLSVHVGYHSKCFSGLPDWAKSTNWATYDSSCLSKTWLCRYFLGHFFNTGDQSGRFATTVCGNIFFVLKLQNQSRFKWSPTLNPLVVPFNKKKKAHPQPFIKCL